MKKQPLSPPPKKPFNLKLAAKLAGLIILFVALFRLLKLYDLYLFAIILYIAVTLGVAIYYIVYNRGVLTEKISPEMLPADWSAEKKQVMIEDIDARRRRSKWAQLVLLPMVFVYLFEILELYVFPVITGLFS